MENLIQKFLNCTNLLTATVTVSITGFLGQHGFLFFAFLLLNIVDWLTGWYVARLNGIENSKTAYKGICKKTMYWIVITLSFFMGYALQHLNKVLGLDLGFLNYVGWFVTAQFLVNEFRSVLENIYCINPDAVPTFLTKGLKIVNDKINQLTNDMGK